MAAHFLSSPQTERNDYSRYEKTGLDVSFSQIPSFMSPVKPEDEIIAHMRVNNGAESARTLATPRTRNALGERRNPPGKAEFTPLLKSATQNRLKKFTENGDAKENELRTPAALKPGFKLDGTPLPEPSEFSSSSVVDEEGTPIAVGASSSVDLSTPLALPKRGEGEVIESGNVLTLKEQELVCNC